MKKTNNVLANALLAIASLSAAGAFIAAALEHNIACAALACASTTTIIGALAFKGAATSNR